MQKMGWAGEVGRVFQSEFTPKLHFKIKRFIEKCISVIYLWMSGFVIWIIFDWILCFISFTTRFFLQCPLCHQCPLLQSVTAPQLLPQPLSPVPCCHFFQISPRYSTHQTLYIKLFIFHFTVNLVLCVVFMPCLHLCLLKLCMLAATPSFCHLY